MNSALALLAGGGCAPSTSTARNPSAPAAFRGTPSRVASPAELELGRALYTKRCASCHGERGHGDGPAARLAVRPPRDLTRGTFKLRSTPPETMPTDSDLLRTITRGFPQFGMPAFTDVSEPERAAVVAYVKTLSPAWSTIPAGAPIQIGAAPSDVRALVPRGRELFVKIGCDECHVGPDGREPPRTDLVDVAGHELHAPDFRAGELYFKRGATPSDVAMTLLAGMPGTPMESYARTLTVREDLWALAAYVASLAGG